MPDNGPSVPQPRQSDDPRNHAVLLEMTTSDGDAYCPVEVERLNKALRRAHEQLSKYDYKGPKQLGRAMLTIERALGIEEDA